MLEALSKEPVSFDFGGDSFNAVQLVLTDFVELLHLRLHEGRQLSRSQPLWRWIACGLEGQKDRVLD